MIIDLAIIKSLVTGHVGIICHDASMNDLGDFMSITSNTSTVMRTEIKNIHIQWSDLGDLISIGSNSSLQLSSELSTNSNWSTSTLFAQCYVIYLYAYWYKSCQYFQSGLSINIFNQDSLIESWSVYIVHLYRYPRYPRFIQGWNRFHIWNFLKIDDRYSILWVWYDEWKYPHWGKSICLAIVELWIFYESIQIWNSGGFPTSNASSTFKLVTKFHPNVTLRYFNFFFIWY